MCEAVVFVVKDGKKQQVMDNLKRVLSDEFDIQHTTIQFECESCTQGAVACTIENQSKTLHDE